jgi:hypothetical protein
MVTQYNLLKGTLDVLSDIISALDAKVDVNVTVSGLDEKKEEISRLADSAIGTLENFAAKIRTGNLEKSP